MQDYGRLTDVLLDEAIDLETEFVEFVNQLADIYQAAAAQGRQDGKNVFRDFLKNVASHFASKIDNEIFEWKPKPGWKPDPPQINAKTNQLLSPASIKKLKAYSAHK